MSRQAPRCHWWLLGIGPLMGLAIMTWFVSRCLDAEPGSSEDVYSRIRIGMSVEETVAVLRTHEHVDCLYSEGAAVDGRPWGGCHIGEARLFESLPPAQEIGHGVLTVQDNDGRDVEVVLGPGGIVSGKRLTPGVLQYRLENARLALWNAREALSSGPWWGSQPLKAYRSLRRRWGPDAAFLVAGLLLVSVWALLRNRGLAGPRRG